MGETAIAIGLHFNKQTIDLRIPTEVSIEHLKLLLAQALATKKINLPTNFNLEIINKPLRLSERNLLRDYPIGDGDQLRIISTESLKEQME